MCFCLRFQYATKREFQICNDNNAECNEEKLQRKSSPAKKKCFLLMLRHQQLKVKRNCVCLVELVVAAKLDHICNSFTNILLRRVVVCWRKRTLSAVLFYTCLNGTRRAIRFLICAAASPFTTYVFIINYNRTCERCELTSFAPAPAPVCVAWALLPRACIRFGFVVR